MLKLRYRFGQFITLCTPISLVKMRLMQLSTMNFFRQIYWKMHFNDIPNKQFVLGSMEEKIALLCFIYITRLCASQFFLFRTSWHTRSLTSIFFRKYPNSKKKIQAVYIQDKYPFEEVENFMDESVRRYCT